MVTASRHDFSDTAGSPLRPYRSSADLNEPESARHGLVANRVHHGGDFGGEEPVSGEVL